MNRIQCAIWFTVFVCHVFIFAMLKCSSRNDAPLLTLTDFNRVNAIVSEHANKNNEDIACQCVLDLRTK